MADQQPVQQSNQQPSQPQKGGYGKRPMWQWIVLYVVIGGIIYFLAYYLFFRGDVGVY